MEVLFLAADSFGVRSMAHLVVTNDVRIGIDMWSSLGPKRYGLPPHRLELLALDASRQVLLEVGKTADVHVITHYHFDHYCLDCPHYEGKRILVKDWRENINKSQQRRFVRFKYKDVAEPSDGKKFVFGGTVLEFSPPFPHGERGTHLGYVISLFIEENAGFVYTSDVGGPIEEEVVLWILSKEPDMVYIDGFPDYLAGHKVASRLSEVAWKNVERIASRVDTVVVDHHAARSTGFFERAEEIGVVTASRFMFGDDLPLEVMRRDLWRGREVSPADVLSRYKVWPGV